MFTLIQNAALCAPRVRSILGIPNLISKSSAQTVKPSFFDNFMKIFYKIKSGQEQDIIIHNTNPLKVVLKQ